MSEYVWTWWSELKDPSRSQVWNEEDKPWGEINSSFYSAGLWVSWLKDTTRWNGIIHIVIHKASYTCKEVIHQICIPNVARCRIKALCTCSASSKLQRVISCGQVSAQRGSWIRDDSRTSRNWRRIETYIIKSKKRIGLVGFGHFGQPICLFGLEFWMFGPKRLNSQGAVNCNIITIHVSFFPGLQKGQLWIKSWLGRTRGAETLNTQTQMTQMTQLCHSIGNSRCCALCSKLTIIYNASPVTAVQLAVQPEFHSSLLFQTGWSAKPGGSETHNIVLRIEVSLWGWSQNIQTS